MTITAIAFTTFKEAVRQPILYVLVALAMVLVLIVGSLPMFTFSVLDDLKMVKDMAVSTSILVGLLVAIFAAVQGVYEEIESWTVVTVLTKPVRRAEFVAGKLLGLVMLGGALHLVMGVAFILLTWVGMYSQLVESSNVYPEYLDVFWSQFAWPTADQLWRGFLMGFLHTLVLTAVAVTVCLRLPVVLAAVSYFVVFVVGHLMDGLAGLVQGAPVLIKWAVGLLGVLLPNLEIYNVAHEVGLGQTITLAEMGWALLYTLTYASAVMLLGVMLFRKREVV